ncbi:MAG TPA: SRPBCC family protein [Telluria sp.]
MLKKIAIGLLAIVAIILGLAATKPNEFAITRVTTIKATPEKILPYISDFHNWAQWSYWDTLDPNMVRTFEGPASGKGAVYGWKGDSKVGQGRMEVLDVKPASVLIKLDFKDPVESNNLTEFTLTPDGDGTKVTWNMKGPMPFISKIMTVFVDMEKMIGPDFEKGLAGLKTAAEK